MKKRIIILKFKYFLWRNHALGKYMKRLKDFRHLNNINQLNSDTKSLVTGAFAWPDSEVSFWCDLHKKWKRLCN